MRVKTLTRRIVQRCVLFDTVSLCLVTVIESYLNCPINR
jgi:hypothetical protein